MLFAKQNKTLKLNGANINYTATLIDNLDVDKTWLTRSWNQPDAVFYKGSTTTNVQIMTEKYHSLVVSA